VYKIKVYVANGYFEYTIDKMENAIEHAQQIMSQGVFRHVKNDNELELHNAVKVKIEGENLGTEYPAIFKRT